jgi:hypothetical protein
MTIVTSSPLILPFALALASTFTAAPASGQSPPPGQVYIHSISYGGTGCPQGTVGSSFANDRQSFTLIFDSFVASSGVGVPPTASRKNCQVNINMLWPNGYTFAVNSIEYRGFTQLPAGVIAEQKATYYFQGEITQASSLSRWVGPVSRDYVALDQFVTGALTWAPCGRVVPVNVNAQVRLIGPPASQAQITTDSIEGKVKQIYNLSWARC